MKTRVCVSFLMLCLAYGPVHAGILGMHSLSIDLTKADDVKSGPDKKIGGPFDVKAITGELKGRQLCYV